MSLHLVGLLVVASGGLFAATSPRGMRAASLLALTLAGFALTLPATLSAFSASSVAVLTLPLADPLPALRFGLDPLSALFSLFMAAVSCAVTAHAAGALDLDGHPHGPWRAHVVAFSALVALMPATVICRSALAFLFAWELMALASFLLVLHHHEEERVRAAALRYLAFGHVGFFFLVAGFALLSAGSGGDDFAAMAARLASPGAAEGGAALLLFVGFAMKAGLVPFHGWLPDAHPAAPSHVSALMSGLMVKTGVYGLLRFALPAAAAHPAAVYAFLAVAASTAALGALGAAASPDLKRLLAYSTVENVGILTLGAAVCALGLSQGVPALAALGAAGALLHAVHHALMKSLLFLCAGNVLEAAGSRDLEDLGGLAARMPGTSAALVTGALAIAGIPPLNGFTGEFLVFLALFHALLLPAAGPAIVAAASVAALALSASVALLAFTKAAGIALLGAPRTPAAARATERPRLALYPVALLAALCVFAGLFPRYALPALAPAVAALASPLLDVPAARALLGPWLSLLGAACTGLALALFLVLALRALLLRGRPLERGPVWGCGYEAPAASMQYTSASFASPLLALAGPLFLRRVELVPPAGVHPAGASARTHLSDPADRLLEAPLAALATRALGLFAFLQSGSTRLYILYGILFLAVALAMTLGGAF